MLSERLSLTGDRFDLVTIGCEGQNSATQDPPACAISREAGGLLEIGVQSSPTSVENNISFRLENIVVRSPTETGSFFVAVTTGGFVQPTSDVNRGISIINCEFQTVQLGGDNFFVDISITGTAAFPSTIVIERSIFDGADAFFKNRRRVFNQNSGVSITNSTFKNCGQRYVYMYACMYMHVCMSGLLPKRMCLSMMIILHHICVLSFTPV